MSHPNLPKDWYGKPGRLALNDEEGHVEVFAALLDASDAGFLVRLRVVSWERFYTWAGVAWIETGE